MKILLTGGVYNHSVEVQESRKSTIEIMLKNELVRRGHEVTAIGNEAKNSLEVLGSGGFDLVHMNHMNRGTLLLALQNKVPTVYTSHDPFIASGIPIPKERPVWSMGRRSVFRNTDLTVALSQNEAVRISQAFGVPSSRIIVVHNGLDVHAYSRPSAESQVKRRHAYRLLFVGQLVPFKGVDLLMNAVKQAIASWAIDIELVIVSQNMTLRQQISSIAESLGIGDLLTIIGPLSREELVNEYYACDVYVHPSRGEGLSTTTMEAMACGKPSIATNVGGTEELLGNWGNVLVPSEDVDALAKAICVLYNKFDSFGNIGNRNQMAIRKHFTVSGMADKYESAYGVAMQHKLKRSLVARVVMATAKVYLGLT